MCGGLRNCKDCLSELRHTSIIRQCQSRLSREIIESRYGPLALSEACVSIASITLSEKSEIFYACAHKPQVGRLYKLSLSQ